MTTLVKSSGEDGANLMKRIGLESGIHRTYTRTGPTRPNKVSDIAKPECENSKPSPCDAHFIGE